MHEILTIQLGHRANYLATHFWNAQESYFTYDSSSEPSPVNHEIHFRPGLSLNGGETFTPRTLIYDLKGGFGGLRKWGGLYDQQLSLEDTTSGQHGGREDTIWKGNVVLQTESAITPSTYQQSLDNGIPNPGHLTMKTVRYWSDFNRVFYHPRSIVQINDYELGSSLMPFEKWDSGNELFMNLDREDDLLDRDLRAWAEECDQMQGVQIWAGADDAWGGFAAKYAERVRDEFGKLGVWVWGVEDEKGKGQRATQTLRLANAARTLETMSTYASMYIPVSIPTQMPDYVRLNHDAQWHVSAILSTAVETMTLPSRLRSESVGRGFLSDMEAALNANGNQRIAQLQCSVHQPSDQALSRIAVRGSSDDRIRSDADRKMMQEDADPTTYTNLDIDLCGANIISPQVSQRLPTDHTFGAVECVRSSAKENQDDERDMTNEDIGYARRRARFTGKAIMENYKTSLLHPLLDSFPDIYPGRSVNAAVAVKTSLSTTSRMSIRVKAMQRIVERMVDIEERESLSNSLGDISDAYVEGWDGSGADSDDE